MAVMRAPGGGTLARPGAPGLSAPRWYSHRLNRILAYRLVAGTAAALPRAVRLRLAAALGVAVGRRLAERDVVAASLARIAPRLPAASRAALVDDVFRHFAMCFADLVTANRSARSPERLVERIAGRERVRAATAAGRGAVVLTAHVGNWELGGRLLAAHVQRPTHVVVEAEVDPGVERFLRGGPAPVRFVTRRDPTFALPLVAALRRGDIVAMQGDRALGTRGDEAAAFFGSPAHFPLGPFVLARAAAVPVVPTFCLLGRTGRYTITVEPPIGVPAGGERAALAAWVARLEAVVREHPEQWFNFFDVWSPAPGH
jgi:KDO2-lipid IV(A) lauroyltransferase